MLRRHVSNGANRRARAGKQLLVSRASSGLRCAFRHFLPDGRELGQAKVENFCVAARGDEKIGGFDVAMNDSGGVSGVEPLGNLRAPIEQRFDFQRAPCDVVLERLAIEKFHGDEAAALVFINFIDGANVGMVQC